MNADAVDVIASELEKNPSVNLTVPFARGRVAVRLLDALKQAGYAVVEHMTDVDDLINRTTTALEGSERGTGLSKDFMLAAAARTLVPELRDALVAAKARIAELETTGPWMEHVERQRAMKRERDGECICNTGPDTEGPDEECPWHGREYRYWVDALVAAHADNERLRGERRCVCPQCRIHDRTAYHPSDGAR